jgi:hypothetical protein
MFDPLSILAVFGPVAVDAGKALINRFIAADNFKPANIDEYSKVRGLDLELFKAMNDAGGSNASYPWVEAIVRLMRPGIALLTMGVWAAGYLGVYPPSPAVDSFAAAIGFYLFGDRSLMYSKKSALAGKTGKG